jgi:tetratricopeptide (TPR) repeat protein
MHVYGRIVSNRVAIFTKGSREVKNITVAGGVWKLLIVAILRIPWCCAQQPILSGPQPAASADANTLTQVQGLLEEAHYQEAEGALRAYLAQNSGSAAGHAMLAYVLLRENKPRESLEEYTRAASIAKPSAEMLERVGQDYALLGDWKDADRWTLRAVQMDPSDADAWYSLGRIRYTDQRFSEASSCFKQVLKLSPKSVKAENNLGLAYEGLNQTDAAVAAYRQAIYWQDQGAPNQRSEQPLLNLGIVLVHRGALDEAERLLTEAATIAPKDPRILEHLGQLHMQKADYAAARRELKQACELDPKNSGLHFLLGQAYRHLGQQKDARAEFAASAQLANAHSR